MKKNIILTMLFSFVLFTSNFAMQQREYQINQNDLLSQLPSEILVKIISDENLSIIDQLSITQANKRLKGLKPYMLDLGIINLLQINLGQQWNLQDIDFIRIIQLFKDMKKDIKKVTVGAIDHLTDLGFIELAKNAPNLTSISLYGSNITDLSMESFAENCKNLESIKLVSCYNITEESIGNLIQKCPKLTSIEIFYCENITKQIIYKIEKNKNNLKIIHLTLLIPKPAGRRTIYDGRFLEQEPEEAPEPFTNADIIYLSNNCPNLTKLSIKLEYQDLCNGELTKDVTDIAIEKLDEACPDLTYLDLTVFESIQTSAFENLKKALPNCEIVMPLKQFEYSEESESEDESESESN